MTAMAYKDYPKRCDRCGDRIRAPRLDVCDGTVAKTVVSLTLGAKRYRFAFRLGSGAGPLFCARADSICFPCLREMAREAFAVLGPDYQPKPREKTTA